MDDIDWVSIAALHLVTVADRYFRPNGTNTSRSRRILAISTSLALTTLTSMEVSPAKPWILRLSWEAQAPLELPLALRTRVSCWAILRRWRYPLPRTSQMSISPPHTMFHTLRISRRKAYGSIWTVDFAAVVDSIPQPTPRQDPASHSCRGCNCQSPHTTAATDAPRGPEVPSRNLLPHAH